MVGIVPGWGQDKAEAETSVLRSVLGFAALAIVSVFTNLKCYWTTFSGNEYKEK